MHYAREGRLELAIPQFQASIEADSKNPEFHYHLGLAYQQQGNRLGARGEFDEACDRLAADGVPLKPDRDDAWRHFSGWRVNYDAVLLGLAALVDAPTARWSSDRGPLRQPRPRILRRLKRKVTHRSARAG